MVRPYLTRLSLLQWKMRWPTGQMVKLHPHLLVPYMVKKTMSTTTTTALWLVSLPFSLGEIIAYKQQLSRTQN